MGENARKLSSERTKKQLYDIYGETEEALKRYNSLAERFENKFGNYAGDFFTAPGRTEIIGNHTDHNCGKVLTASINMDTIGIARINNSNMVRVVSEPYNQEITLDLDQLDRYKKAGGTYSLLAGMFEGVQVYGFNISGFDAYLHTNVIEAAGVSSSASFEMLICSIVNYYFNEGKMDCVQYAKIGKYAENTYWCKNSGLLDQMACAIGGTVYIDFVNPEKPFIKNIDFDYDQMGYDLVMINTGRGHADLSAEYSMIPNEMKMVARYYDKEYLSEVEEETFIKDIPDIRVKLGDRAVMRALHFFEENKKVARAMEVIENRQYKQLIPIIYESGNSSWKWLQNCYCDHSVNEQSIPIVLAITELYLRKVGQGCCRVHGGGFAGVIMCLIPKDFTLEYLGYMEGIVRRDNMYVLKIRKTGAKHLDL